MMQRTCVAKVGQALSPAKISRKKLLKRAGPDHSQHLRRSFQFLFLALNFWIGADFYRFVRFYETGGRTAAVSRPPSVEGWLPIASLMNLKIWLATGALPRLHPAGMFRSCSSSPCRGSSARAFAVGYA